MQKLLTEGLQQYIKTFIIFAIEIFNQQFCRDHCELLCMFVKHFFKIAYVYNI